MGLHPFLTYFGTLIFFSSTILSNAADTISPAQSIRDGETLVSASQRFELGFFSPGKSNNRYLGIWYKFSPSTVVWVANRRNPITDKQGVLVVNEDGNLLLISKDKRIFWSTNSPKVAENPVAQLLDSGNFVLRDISSDSYVWQSFDYPSDTLLTGMKLGWNLKTRFERHLTSWASDDDPFPGGFSLRLDIQGLPELFIAVGSRKLGRSGPWNGQRFVGVPMLNQLVFKPMLVHKQDELFFTYEPANNTVITHLLLHQSGTVKRLVWNRMTAEWTVLYSMPFDLCDNYGQGGANGNCRISKTPICECLKGFMPKAEDVWDTQGVSESRKCIEKLPADCPSGEGFYKLPSMKLPDFNWWNSSMNLKECEAECYKNCSCKAFANSDVRGGGSGCLMWFGELIDIRECPAGGYLWGQDFYLRVPASELGLENIEEEAEVPLIDWCTIVAATNNFSQANMIGKSGFGSVYKGALSTKQEIAVKRLSQNSGQGVEEFKNELVLISKLQHRNLVGLLGCCTHGDERILVYEYMPNKSLDHFIFDCERSKLLEWRKRFDIIIGIIMISILKFRTLDWQEFSAMMKKKQIQIELPEHKVVSGKKNREFFHPDSQQNLLGHAWVLWNNERALELMDTCLEGSFIESQVFKCIHVGLLCVQRIPEDRPDMSSVVFMLANDGLSLSMPREPGFFTERGFLSGSASYNGKSQTANVMSITTQDGR